MSSDAAAGGAPAAPAAPAAAGGGGSMAMIAVIVVVVIVVVAVVGYVMMSGGSGDSLSGEWTVSGGEMKIKMVVNNDTANTIWTNQTIPASSEVIDFDNPGDMPEGMVYHDLGDGEFEITSFEMMGADFGTIHGSYDINGDTMTLHFTASGTYIDGTDYMQIDMDYTVNFAKA